MENRGDIRSVRQFEALLEPILKLAYGTAYHMTHHREDAEDLVQEAALRAFKAFATFHDGTNFKAWFFTILTNLIRQRYRDRCHEPRTVSTEEDSDLFLYSQTRKTGLHRGCKDPAALFMERVEGEQAEAAIQALPEEYRIVASLYFMGDFAYGEIADMIDCPVGTVRSRLHRSRKMLQKAIWQSMQEKSSTPTLKSK